MTTSLRPGAWYGEIERAADVGGVHLSIVQHDHARAIELHEHALPYFCFLAGGRYRETHKGQTIEYEPFSIAFHPSRFAHSDEIMSEGATFFAIELREEWERRLGHRFNMEAWRFELQHGEAVWLAVKLLDAFLNDRLDDWLAVDAIVSEMLAIALRLVDRDRPQRRWVRELKYVLRETYAGRVSLEELADNVGLHPASVARGFRCDEGVTIGEYLNRIRVQNACRMMTDPSAALADIALSCGFADQSHLNRVFKSVTGMPPGALRRSALTEKRARS